MANQHSMLSPVLPKKYNSQIGNDAFGLVVFSLICLCRLRSSMIFPGRWGNGQFLTGLHPRQSRGSFWAWVQSSSGHGWIDKPSVQSHLGVSLGIRITNNLLFTMPYNALSFLKSRLDTNAASSHTGVGKSDESDRCPCKKLSIWEAYWHGLTIKFTQTSLFYCALQVPPVERASTWPTLTQFQVRNIFKEVWTQSMATPIDIEKRFDLPLS